MQRLVQRTAQRLLLSFLGGLFIILGFPAHARVMQLGLNEASPVRYQQTVDTVFISNPDVADYQVVNGNQLVVFGRNVGTTTLLVLDAQGRTLDNRTVFVNKSLARLQQEVAARFPGSDVDISNMGEQVVLSGLVDSEVIKRNIYTFVGEWMGKEYEEDKRSLTFADETLDIGFLTQRTYKGLLNNIEVNTVQQVNVKLTVAEVSHSFIRQLGAKWGSMVGSEGDVFLGSGQFFNMYKKINARNIGLYISAADDDSMGQILAEPNLSVISGETASFLAGGEIPIVTILDNSQDITYKEFGVRLQLAAEVLNDDKINLTLEPEVSAIDMQGSNNSLDLPAFKTRRARTTVQLADGESFVLGGLLNSEEREALSRIPIIGDVPILGAMFRHTRSERVQTEMIIVATVNLVRPVQPGLVQLPTMERAPTLARYFKLDMPAQKTGPEKIKAQQQMKSLLDKGGFKE